MYSQAAQAIEPVSGDFQQIYKSRSDALVVWHYADNPEIFVFDFPNLTAQGRSFNRVTQFSEQQFSEPYPRVLSDAELARYIEASKRTLADFAFGHDILVSEFVQFFNFAKRDKVELNQEEISVRDFLIGRGLVRVWRDIYQPMRPNAVILSVPQPQDRRQNEPRISEHARYTILLHELSHAEYYSNPGYANYCLRFWQESLTDAQRQAFKDFLSKYNYSLQSDELLLNEAQAYLMFTPDPASFSASKLGVSDGELEAMRESFRRGKPPTRLPLRWTGSN